MKRLVLLTFAVSTLMVACKKEEKEEVSKYQGTWEFRTQEGSFDSTYTTSINSSGSFSYKFVVGFYEVQIKGDVSETGVVSGEIGQPGITIGQMKGNLVTSGSGSGVYILQGDTLNWEATRQ